MAETERRPFDTSLQGLAPLYSQHFLAWLRGPNAVWQQELNSVIVAQQRRADFLIRYLDGEGQERLLHVEFQTVVQRGEPREDLPSRMATYAAFVLNRYGQAPDQVLVLLRNTASTRRVPDHFAQGRMRVEYQVVRLWEQDPEVILTSGLVGLMPLVPLMRSADVEVLLTACVEAVESGLESQQERNEVLTVVGLLASLRDWQRVTEFFRRSSLMNLLQQTPLFQELTRDLVQQAVQEEALRGRIEFLLRLLESKFGPLSDDLRQQLQQLTDLEQLENLFDVALEVPTLDDFRAHYER